MTEIIKDNIQPGSPAEWYDLGCSLRRQARFGEAINAFAMAASTARTQLSELHARPSLSGNCTDHSDCSGSGDCSGTGGGQDNGACTGSGYVNNGNEQPMEDLNSIMAKALASIDLIKEINGFVNVDLMNP